MQDLFAPASQTWEAIGNFVGLLFLLALIGISFDEADGDDK